MVLDFKQRNDHTNLLLHYMRHIFSYVYVCNNSSSNTKPFNIETHFFNYAKRAYWTSKKLTALYVNILKYNNVVTEDNNEKKPEKTNGIWCWWIQGCSATCFVAEHTIQWW